MTQESLAMRLRVLRAERALSLTEAAERAGIQRQTLALLERGERRPHDPTLAKLARAYGVPVRELLEDPVLAGTPGKAEAPYPGQSRSDSLVEEEAPGLRPIDLALGAARRQAVLTEQAFNRVATSGVPQSEDMRPLNEALLTLLRRNPADVAEGLVDLARDHVALGQEAAQLREQVAALQEELARERARVR
jgi:transcriptional regulator with XRE-family HTH domain